MGGLPFKFNSSRLNLNKIISFFQINYPNNNIFVPLYRNTSGYYRRNPSNYNRSFQDSLNYINVLTSVQHLFFFHFRPTTSSRTRQNPPGTQQRTRKCPQATPKHHRRPNARDRGKSFPRTPLETPSSVSFSQYLTKQTTALREVNDSRLRIYEQLEISIQDLERANHRLAVENAADKKHIKTLTANIETLEGKCDDLQGTIDDLRIQVDILKRKAQRPKSERTNAQNRDAGIRLRHVSYGGEDEVDQADVSVNSEASYTEKVRLKI